MIAESLAAAKIKCAVGALGLIVLGVADQVVTPYSVEDLSFKGAAVAIIVWMGRLILKMVGDHKTEMQGLRDKHEERLTSVIEANTKSNERVCELAEEQANYFKTVTRSIVDERLGRHDGERIP